MRKIALLGFVMLVLVSTAALAGDELPEGQTKVTIPVSGMSCGACCNKVEGAVAKLDGVVKVNADYQKGEATVIYEKDKVSLDKIVETINTKTSFKAKAPKEATS